MTNHLDKELEERTKREANQEGDVTPQNPPAQEKESIPIPEKVLESPTKNKKGKAVKKVKEGGEVTVLEGGKSIKSGTGSSPALQKIKDKINCSFCGNNMRYSDKITVIPVEGKKIPKGTDGQLRFESPGVPKGQMVGVLCDTCVYAANTYAKKLDGTPATEILSVVAVGKDGVPKNVRVSEL